MRHKCVALTSVVGERNDQKWPSASKVGRAYRGSSLSRNRTPPRIPIEPHTCAYCRVLRGSVF